MSGRVQVWILPDRSQSGELNVIWHGHKCGLCDVIDVHQLPRGLVLGVPEELIRKYGADDPIYAQLIRDEEQQFFSLSTCCGLDEEGRIVHLTYLEIGSLADEPVLGWLTEGLPEESSRRVENIKQRIEQKTDRWACEIVEMLRVAHNKKYIKSFANVETPRLQPSPVWAPQKVRRRRIKLVVGLGIAVAAAIGWYLLYDHKQKDESLNISQPAIQQNIQNKDRY